MRKPAEPSAGKTRGGAKRHRVPSEAQRSLEPRRQGEGWLVEDAPRPLTVIGTVASRPAGCFNDEIFDRTAEPRRKERVRAAVAAFARIDWQLTEDGMLEPGATARLDNAIGRPAIEDQLNRLRRGTEDPGLLLGTAKE